jgi:chemotaxis protein MotB
MSTQHNGRTRRSKGPHEEEAENSERWAVSYADMMTVLVGLFIVMYAISQVDEAKFEDLRKSLAAGFGAGSAVIQGSSGALTGADSAEIMPSLSNDISLQNESVAPNDKATATGASGGGLSKGEADLQAATAEYDRLEGVIAQMTAALQAQSLDDRVQFKVTERGLIIGLVADDVFFSAASADLTETAARVIDAITPIVAGLPNEISIEGHANILPVSGRYATNWELSADRATQVLRRMVEVDSVAASRIGAVGFGDARPIEDNTLDGLEANRRVDIVVLSSLPEDIRLLLPAIAASQGS